MPLWTPCWRLQYSLSGRWRLTPFLTEVCTYLCDVKACTVLTAVVLLTVLLMLRCVSRFRSPKLNAAHRNIASAPLYSSVHRPRNERSTERPLRRATVGLLGRRVPPSLQGEEKPTDAYRSISLLRCISKKHNIVEFRCDRESYPNPFYGKTNQVKFKTALDAVA